MIRFVSLRPVSLGYIPTFFSEGDPRPAREQINEAYAHGGGWRPSPDFNMDPKTFLLISHYEEDPNLKPLAMAMLRNELILFYDHEWLAIVQPDGSFEVARVN